MADFSITVNINGGVGKRYDASKKLLGKLMHDTSSNQMQLQIIKEKTPNMTGYKTLGRSRNKLCFSICGEANKLIWLDWLSNFSDYQFAIIPLNDDCDNIHIYDVIYQRNMMPLHDGFYISFSVGATGKHHKLSNQDLLDELAKYTRAVRNLTAKNRKDYCKLIPNNQLNIDYDNYHLDHKLSIKNGFLLNIPVEIVASIYNLEYLTQRDNNIKGCKSSISENELMALYEDNQFNMPMSGATHNLTMAA